MTDQIGKKNQHLVPIFMWAGLLMSVFIYLGMTFAIGRNGDIASLPGDQTTEASTELSTDQLAGPPADPLATVFYPLGLAMALAGLALGHARSLWKDAASAMKLNIISLALCESCALMGFMIYMTGRGDATEPRSMMILAAVCMATLFPTPKKMRLA